jgi:hypothetical protein
VPAGASAQYPPPQDPGKVQSKPKGPHHTYTVCKKRHRCDFRKIQKAVNHARAGDTIRVANGTYREAVLINGKKKRYLRLIGNPKHPRKVALRAKGNMQNAIFVNNADKVSVNGFYARGYKSNGFFFTNVNGYDMNHLVARQTGVYGLYAFNTIGGTMRNSEAFYVNDGAFYIGQTPPQDKPKQTFVRNVSGWGSPIGFSATNMRYVTITKSRFYNNGVGIVPNALDSEKYPPPERNVITDNDIFWNNLNFHIGHPPFKVNESSVASLVPMGTGILLLGGRENRVEDNRIFGNYLGGIGAIDGFLLKENPQAVTLDRNIVKGNQFGRGGTDTNGRDIVYDGSGTGNCFTLAPTDTVLDPSTLGTCSGGKNPFSQPTRDEMLSWIGEGATKGWRKPGHPPKKGYKPLESFK